MKRHGISDDGDVRIITRPISGSSPSRARGGMFRDLGLLKDKAGLDQGD
jgi:hypothetical protein